jgi:hypothetical protein
MDLPTSGPKALNTHAHSLQAQPSKFSLATHTSLRRLAAIAHPEIRCGYVSTKGGAALLIHVTARTTAALFVALSELLPK